MNQKLSDWASIAEIVSGIAVVITLVFLVAGIRDNTNATRATAYQTSTSGLNQWRMWLVSDPDRVRIFTSAMREGSLDDLTDADLTVLGFSLGALFGVYESAFYADQYELLGPSEAARYRRAACDFYVRLVATGIWDLDGGVGTTVTDEFQQYLESKCLTN